MVRIGVFARLSEVSIKTLRHYDDIGLLAPAYVDDWSGYRYYTLEQLPRLYRILALKDLGFSLDEIAGLLRRNLAPAEMTRLLRDKQTGDAETGGGGTARAWRGWKHGFDNSNRRELCPILMSGSRKSSRCSSRPSATPSPTGSRSRRPSTASSMR